MDSLAPHVDDFAGYWAAGHLFVTGATRYAPDDVLALQRSIGWPLPWANLVWYAPWSLLLFGLFGALPASIARPSWVAVQMALLFFAVDRLWLNYGGQRSRRWIAMFVTVAFYPTLALAIWHQASALPLLGLVGFLLLAQRRRDFRAGACLALVALKPQLLYVFWLGLAVWVWQTRRWRIPAGFLSAAAATTALVAVINAPFLSAYLEHLAQRPPNEHIVPTLGGLARLLLGPQHYWLQFGPAAAGLLWLIRRAARGPDRRDLGLQLPDLVLVSFLCGIFFWTPDLVMLSFCFVPVIVKLAGRPTYAHLKAYAAVFVLLTVTTAVLHEFLDDHWFFWLPFSYAALFKAANGGSVEPPQLA
jgi:hypothetical protein